MLNLESGIVEEAKVRSYARRNMYMIYGLMELQRHQTASFGVLLSYRITSLSSHKTNILIYQCTPLSTTNTNHSYLRTYTHPQAMRGRVEGEKKPCWEPSLILSQKQLAQYTTATVPINPRYKSLIKVSHKKDDSFYNCVREVGVCAYVCLHVCMCVCVYVCMYVCVCVCVYVV